MKKLIALMLTVTMIISLAACGKAPETTDTPETAEKTETQEAAKEQEVAEEQEATKENETADAPVTDEEPEIAENDADSTFPRLIINSEPYYVSASEGFDNAGFTAAICDATAKYSFKSSSKDVTWSVYILDEEFEDVARFIPQAFSSALEGDGTIEIEEGKYVYIQCSVNGFTADEPSDAVLSIEYAE